MTAGPDASKPAEPAPYQSAKDRFERRYLISVIRSAGGNISEASRLAGVDRTTLYRLMQKHELTREEALQLHSPDAA